MVFEGEKRFPLLFKIVFRISQALKLKRVS